MAVSILAYPHLWWLFLVALLLLVGILYERKVWQRFRRASKHLAQRDRRRQVGAILGRSQLGMSDAEVERELYPHASRRRSA